jgi:hypothetical protein
MEKNAVNSAGWIGRHFSACWLGEALPKLNAEERRAIRARLNELDGETWFDNGELSEQEKAIIEARLDEYDRNPEVGSSWQQAKARGKPISASDKIRRKGKTALGRVN